METWKDIKNYEGIYQVSNLGRVKVLDRYIVRKRGTKKTPLIVSFKKNPLIIGPIDKPNIVKEDAPK